MDVVVDTSVFVSALLGPGGASREVVRRCLLGVHRPVMGVALFHEYESVLAREPLFANCLLQPEERERLLDAFLSVCRWVRVYFLWRPSLPDEADNHLVELAVAARAGAIVTQNVRDVARGELRFAGLRVLSPAALLEEER